MLHFFYLLMIWNLALQCLQIFYCSFWCWLLYAAQTCKNSHYYNDVKIKWNTGEIQWHCDALRWNGIQGQAKWNTGTIYVGDSRNTGEIAAFKGEVGLASPTIFLRKLFNNKVKKTFRYNAGNSRRKIPEWLTSLSSNIWCMKAAPKHVSLSQNYIKFKKSSSPRLFWLFGKRLYVDFRSK